MTEEEAKTKQCPIWGLAAWMAYHTGNMPKESVIPMTRCGASDCMMWRVDSNYKGYCGLGGKP